MSSKQNLRFATKLIHDGYDPDQTEYGPLVPPLFLSTNYKHNSLINYPTSKYTYVRLKNPNGIALEENLAPLENGKYALVYAAGMGAISTVCHLLNSGDHALVVDSVYHGTQTYFEVLGSKVGITATFIDMTNENEVDSHLKSNTKMVWIETPTNPLLKVCDIKAICKIVRDKLPDAIIVADNTLASPYYQKPLDLGVDIVLHSVTKYLNGHCDVLMGVIITNNEKLYQTLKYYRQILGTSSSPFDCNMALRGLKTFEIRMDKIMSNALKVARSLEENPRILKVIYPLLTSHPQYELCKSQMTGFSGIISVYIKGEIEEAETFVKSLKIFTLAESLGGVESIIKHNGLMNHANLPKEEREKLGIGDNFFRISIGLEDADDLIEDLNQALEKAIKLN